MSLLSWLIYAYFRTALLLGAKMHVYNVSGRWGSRTDKIPHRYNAAWEIQNDLFKRGFHKCPSCFWATVEFDEHIKKGEGYCYEQANGNPSVPWDEELNGVLAYEKMPTRLDHWPAQ